MNDSIPITIRLDAGLSGTTLGSVTFFTVSWTVDNIEISTEKIVDYICTEYKTYNIVCHVIYTDRTSYPETQTEFNTYITLNLLRPIEFNFRIYNNNGPAPLTFVIEDITDYSNTGFYPNYWRWQILNQGCVGGKQGVKRRSLTISEVGQYGIKTMVTDGTIWYTIILDDVVVVTGNDQTGVQLELAHHSGSENMRHVISSNNSYNNSEENSISISMWETDKLTDELGNNKILEIRSDEKTYIKSTNPLEDELYDIGSDYERWKNIFFKSANISNNSQSKILVLWNGD